MSIITRIKSAIGLEARSTLGVNGWPVPISASAVTPATAQGVSAVYACVQAISETTASLPLILFKRNGDDRERASDHPLYRVLHDQANPEQTALEAREYMQACVLLRGNAFARIVRGWDGQVRELWPLNPDNVTVQRTSSGLVYDYTKDGVLTRLLAHEVLHLRHRLGDDGVMGVSRCPWRGGAGTRRERAWPKHRHQWCQAAGRAQVPRTPQARAAPGHRHELEQPTCRRLQQWPHGDS